MRTLVVVCILCLPSRLHAQSVTSIEPSAPVLPSNTLRFYITFDQPARGIVHQSSIKLVDSKDIPVENAFMDFGQELWSPDGKRLTVFFDPGKIKRGVEAPHSELSPLKEGESYRIAFGRIQHAFRVGPAIRERIDPSSWVISVVRAPARSVDIGFDRVMDTSLLRDQLQVEDEEGRPLVGTVRVIGGGCGVRFKPSRLLKRGRYRIRVGPLLEDVAGNRIDEALDHPVNEKPRKSSGWVTTIVAR